MAKRKGATGAPPPAAPLLTAGMLAMCVALAPAAWTQDARAQEMQAQGTPAETAPKADVPASDDAPKADDTPKDNGAAEEDGAPAPGAPHAAPLQAPPPGVDPRAVETRPALPLTPDMPAPEEAVVEPVPVLAKTGTSSWEDGFDSIVAALKTVTAELDRLGLKRSGDVEVLYTASDEAGFEFEAQIPFSGATAQKPSDGVTLSASLAGKALKFNHKGSFADMDQTYESIANYLDDKNMEAQDAYLEVYRTDPMTTPPDALNVDIYIPTR